MKKFLLGVFVGTAFISAAIVTLAAMGMAANHDTRYN